MNFTVTVAHAGAANSRSACLRLAGDLDYQTTGTFIDTVDRLLGGQPAPARLHVDCAELTFCDSAGLSGLLLVHRRTGQAGVRLQLDQRPPILDRLLEITGTFEYLVATDPAEETGVR
jgi:anti-anti-sigma factor